MAIDIMKDYEKEVDEWIEEVSKKDECKKVITRSYERAYYARMHMLADPRYKEAIQAVDKIFIDYYKKRYDETHKEP